MYIYLQQFLNAFGPHILQIRHSRFAASSIYYKIVCKFWLVWNFVYFYELFLFPTKLWNLFGNSQNHHNWIDPSELNLNLSIQFWVWLVGLASWLVDCWLVVRRGTWSWPRIVPMWFIYGTGSIVHCVSDLESILW